MFQRVCDQANLHWLKRIWSTRGKIWISLIHCLVSSNRLDPDAVQRYIFLFPLRFLIAGFQKPMSASCARNACALCM